MIRVFSILTALCALTWLCILTALSCNAETLRGPASIAFECRSSISKAASTKVLGEVQKGYQSVASMQADFEQDSYLAALDTAESSSGRVLFKKPGRMKWSYQAPEEQEFVLRDNVIWLYQPEIKQVLIDQLSTVLLTDLPVSFLMGVGDLSENFTVLSGCESSSGTVLTLEPKVRSSVESKEPQELKLFKLLVQKSSNLPAGAQVVDSVGNVTSILLKSITSNEEITDQQFAVQYPSGTDITDRRARS